MNDLILNCNQLCLDDKEPITCIDLEYPGKLYYPTSKEPTTLQPKQAAAFTMYVSPNDTPLIEWGWSC